MKRNKNTCEADEMSSPKRANNKRLCIRISDTDPVPDHGASISHLHQTPILQKKTRVVDPNSSPIISSCKKTTGLPPEVDEEGTSQLARPLFSPSYDEINVMHGLGEEEYETLLFIKSLSTPDPVLMPLLPSKSPDAPRVCLALDLDETLVHCSIEPIDDADLTFTVELNFVEYQVFVKKRPFLMEFLQQVSVWFETVLFTASQKVYANRLLDILDPQNIYIHHRLFRDSCMNVAGNFIKNLAGLGRDLSQVALLDNSPQAFGFQVNNGIPIQSWFSNPDDRSLLDILPFLDSLRQETDVRPLIRRTYRLEELIQGLSSPASGAALTCG